jgi:hypothetical protein
MVSGRVTPHGDNVEVNAELTEVHFTRVPETTGDCETDSYMAAAVRTLGKQPTSLTANCWRSRILHFIVLSSGRLGMLRME